MVNFFQLKAEDIDQENINAAYDAEKKPSRNGSGFQRSPHSQQRLMALSQPEMTSRANRNGTKRTWKLLMNP